MGYLWSLIEIPCLCHKELRRQGKRNTHSECNTDQHRFGASGNAYAHEVFQPRSCYFILSTQMNDHSWSFMIILSLSLSLSIAISESSALPAQAFLPSFRVQIRPLILWRHPRMEWPRNTQVKDGEGLARHGVASSSASEPCQCKLLLDGSNGPIFYFMAQSSNSQSHKITQKPKKRTLISRQW